MRHLFRYDIRDELLGRLLPPRYQWMARILNWKNSSEGHWNCMKESNLSPLYNWIHYQWTKLDMSHNSSKYPHPRWYPSYQLRKWYSRSSYLHRNCPYQNRSHIHHNNQSIVPCYLFACQHGMWSIHCCLWKSDHDIHLIDQQKMFHYMKYT